MTYFPLTKTQREWQERVADLAQRELATEVRRRLSADEWRLLELREEGLEWSEIADQLGGSADALRKKWARACLRVQEEVGVQE